MFRKIVCLVIMLQLAAGVALAASPTPAYSVVQIQSVTHDAQSPLPAGKRITVRLRGTPGGIARFHIAGVAAGVGMQEIRSKRAQGTALYVGSYVVRPGDAAASAAIFATLRARDQEIIQVSDRPVTIDARPPQVTARLPLPQGPLSNLRPNIVLGFQDGESSINLSRVKLLVNGQDVTHRAAITPAFAAYTPQVPFTPGSVRVEAVVPDRSGNAARVDWTFAVAAPNGLIKSVTVNPAAGLRPGDYLTVVMVGAPAGQASFTVTGSSRRLAMRESSPASGVYVGTYPVGSGDQRGQVSVLVRLQKGSRFSTAAAATVPVFGRTPRPTVVSSATSVVFSERGIERIALAGRAQPALKVLTRLSSRAETPWGTAWTPIVESSTPARPDGTWRTTFGPVVFWPDAALFLTVVAIDPLGQRSAPVTVELVKSPAPPAAVTPSEPEQIATASEETSPSEPQALAPTIATAALCPAGQVLTPTGLCASPVETGSAQANAATDRDSRVDSSDVAGAGNSRSESERGGR